MISDETMARLAHLRDELAAREQYGNGDDHAAGLIRDELTEVEDQVEQAKPKKSTKSSGGAP